MRRPSILYAVTFLQCLLFMACHCLVLPVTEVIEGDPDHNDPNEQTSHTNCTDDSSTYSEKCWAELGLSEYTKKWINYTPTCEGNMMDSMCCEKHEPWAKCFLRLARGDARMDCTVLNDQNCVNTGDMSKTLDPSIYNHVRYVAKNIYDINNFISTYFDAIIAAQSDAMTIVGAITAYLNPIKGTSVSLVNLISVLALGLAFLAAPELGAAVLAFEVGTRFLAQGLLVGLTQAPGLVRALLPEGSPASQVAWVGDLDDRIGDVSDGLKEGFAKLLYSIMGDAEQFIAFASSGQWSGQSTPDRYKAITGFDYMLKTHVTSQALKMANYYAFTGNAPSGGGYVTEEAWNNDSYDAAPADGKEGGKPAGPLFRRSYRSTVTGRVYQLIWNHHGYESAPENGHKAHDVLFQIESQGWADLDVLFDGAWNCTAAGNAGKDQVLGVNPDGSLNPACISVLPVYFNCYPAEDNGCPQHAPDGSCPFGHFGDCGHGEGVEWMYNN